jgi:hypothetical protein
MSSTDFYDLVKRAFKEQLDTIGVDITCNGFFLEKAAVLGVVEDERRQEAVGSGIHLDTKVEMLSDAFDALQVVLNESEFTVNVTPFESATMTIVNVHRDPQDPVVLFYGSRDY